MAGDNFEIIEFNNNQAPYISDTNLRLMQTRIDNGITAIGQLLKDAIGLGDTTTKTHNNTDINTINLSEFAYLNDCNYGETSIDNGYLLTLIYTTNYKFQLYITATTNIIKFRKKINGTWQSWTNLTEDICQLSSYLKNSWEANGQNFIKKDGNGVKHIIISVRYGTSNIVATIPPDFCPSETVLIPMNNRDKGSYAILYTNGNIEIDSNLFTSGESNILISGMYL